MNDRPTPQSTPANRDRDYQFLGLRIVGDFGATIAVPVVLLALLGKWLDARWGTRPWLLIAGFALAAAISALSILKKAKRYGREYDALNRTHIGPAPEKKDGQR